MLRKHIPISGLALAAGLWSILLQAQDEFVELFADQTPTESIEVGTPPDNQGNKTPADARNRLIEQIIVTAQKREEDIKDVPISMQAFTADYLDAKTVFDQRDLPKITPGLSFSNPIGFAVAYLRGIGTDAFILADPLVVSYVDGVYFPNSTSQFLKFDSIERIEVLKGPQGTLFGRNALGGAIKVETRPPDLDQMTGSLRAEYGPESFGFSSATLNLPLIKSHLAVSVSAYAEGRNDFRDGRLAVGLPEERALPREHNDAQRIKVLWEPINALSVRLNVFDYDQHNTRLLASANATPSGLGESAIEPQNPYRPLSNENYFNRNSGRTWFGDASLALPWFDLKLLGSDQQVRSTRSYDFDGSPEPMAYFEGRPIFADTRTGEFRILSNDQGPVWLRWIAGLYAYESEGGIRQARLRALGASLTDSTLLGQPAPGLGEFAGTLGGLGIPIPNGLDVDFSGIQLRESLSWFGEASIDLSELLSLTIGGRFLSARRTVLQSRAALINADGSRTPFRSNDVSNDPALQLRTREFDPKVVLNFRPPPGRFGLDPLFYLSYQTASIADTFNVISPFNPPDLAKGSQNRAIELGYKSRLLDGRLDFNAAAFHYVEKDPQLQIISLQTGGAVRFENADEITISGAEFQLMTELLPDSWPGSLVLDMGATWLDHEYSDYDGAGGFTGPGGSFSEDNDFTGNPVQYAADLTGIAGLTQTLRIPGGPLEIGVSYSYNSGFFTFAQATPNVEVPAYSTLDLSISYKLEAANLRATLFSRNVLDEDFMQSRFITDFGVNDFPDAGRVTGGRLEFDF